MIRVLFNKKGGVGKSSLAVNLAAISAAQGFKTLVIDLDPQSNSTHYLLGRSAAKPSVTIYDFFEQMLRFHLRATPLHELVTPTEHDNLELIAGAPQLGLLEAELQSRHKIYKLRDALQVACEHYEHIYIDTAPALNFYSMAALIAAQRCLVPMDCDEFARQALYELNQHIQEIQDDHNAALELEGIIVNQFQSQAKLPALIVEELSQEGFPVLPDYVPSSVKMKESHQQHLPLIYAAPKHKLTQALQALHQSLNPNAPAK